MTTRTRGLLTVLLGVALALGAVLGVAPREALAGTDTYTSLIPTGDEVGSSIEDKKVTFNGKKWYVIEDNSEAENEGTLTLLAADNVASDQVFNSDTSKGNKYSQSDVKAALDDMTNEGGAFAGVKDAIVTIESLMTYKYKSDTEEYDTAEDVKLYLLSTQEANAVPQNVRRAGDGWWLRSPGDEVNSVAYVGPSGSVNDENSILVNSEIGVRPALMLNLKSVIFESESRTFSLPGKVTGVTLNPSTAQTIDVNGKVTFTATVEPSNATDKTVTWSSSDEGVATVEGGVVTGVAPGTATITCTATNGTDTTEDDVVATCDVTVTAPAPAEVPPVSVTAHVQRKGTLAAVSGGAIAGTTGKSLRMESIRLTVPGASATGGIEYRGHVQRKGWEKAWARDGAMAGTEGKSRRMEAVQIRLWGDMAAKYDVYYRVHVQKYGWMAWAKNGASAGTQGMSRRAEAIQVVLVAKDAPAPAADFQGATQAYGKSFAKK